MNSVAVVIALSLLVAVASGLGYNSYNRYPSIRGNSWNTWASRGGRLFDNGGWDIGHHGGYGRHKRAAVGYGSYYPYNRNNIGAMFNRRSGRWRSNSRFSGGWNQYGY